MKPIIPLAVLAVAASVALTGAYAQAPAAGAGAGASATPAATPPPEDKKVETFATLPTPDATENICQQRDGSFYITQIQAKKVIKVTPDKKVSEFAAGPEMAELLGAGCGDNEVVFVQYNKSFRGAPPAAGQPATANFSFADTDAHILVYDLSGHMTADIPTQKGMGFNGLTYSGTPGIYYAANSNGGGIYLVNTKTKKISVWWNDDAYGPSAGAPIGLNGVKAKNGWVYFSSGTLGQAPMRGLYRIQVGNDGTPVGRVEKVEDSLAVDDFGIATDGSAYFTAGTTLYRVAPGGMVTKLADPVQGGPSAVVSLDGKYVYWPTRGGTANQRLLRVAIP